MSPFLIVHEMVASNLNLSLILMDLLHTKLPSTLIIVQNDFLHLLEIKIVCAISSDLFLISLTVCGIMTINSEQHFVSIALLINVSSILNKFLSLNTCWEERNFENATANPKVAILFSSGHSQLFLLSSACAEDKNTYKNDVTINKGTLLMTPCDSTSGFIFCKCCNKLNKLNFII
ncbi:hypothetical protein AGLY_007750 [Aphis glycines]|uniref:Uncharacterized protein n=1 Tax=Aphis glycines TaxID=307491 RepID=A0A6G0TMZ1_APHGL|nr:hypothetical protein AGLY_007750 [Aphis glycines]